MVSAAALDRPSPLPPTGDPPPRRTRAEQARINGARSRGPVTPEGKARAARNARKHGLTAALHLAADAAEAAEIAALAEDLAAELAPRDLLESFLVGRLAAAMWQAGRGDRLEAQAFAGPAAPDRPRLDLALRYQAAIGRRLAAALRELRRLRAEPLAAGATAEAAAGTARGPDSPPPLPALPNEPEPPSPRPGPPAGTAPHPNEPEAPPPQRLAPGRAAPRPNEPDASLDAAAGPPAAARPPAMALRNEPEPGLPTAPPHRSSPACAGRIGRWTPPPRDAGRSPAAIAR